MRKKKKPSRSKAKGYGRYSSKALDDAYAAVTEKKMSVYQAANQFRVPYMTLHDRVKGKVALGTPMGRKAMFTHEQEGVLQEYFKFLMSIGYGFSKAEFLQIVTDQAVHCGKKKKKGKFRVGKIWYYSFLKRHPEVTSVRPYQRPACATAESIQKYYKELGHFLKKHGLANKPQATFVMDKVQIDCDESEKLQDTCDDDSDDSSSSSSAVIVIGAGNSAGYQLPPFFVFPEEKKLPKVSDTTPGTSGCISAVNRVDREVLMKYLFEHFLPLARGSGTDDSVLLLYDSHRFPMFPGLSDWAQDKKLYMFPLPPHTSCVQKDGISILDEFDYVYGEELQSVLDRNADVSKNTVCQVACQAYVKVGLQDELKVFFKNTGIIPFDPSAMPWPSHKPLDVKSGKSTDDPDSDSESDSDDPVHVVKTTKKRKPASIQTTSKKKLKIQHSSHPGGSKRKLTVESDSDIVYSEDDSSIKSEAESPEQSIVENDGEQACCVCGDLEPTGSSRDTTDDNHVVEWVECDACPHWTHLGICSRVDRVGSDEAYECPHCC